MNAIYGDAMMYDLDGVIFIHTEGVCFLPPIRKGSIYENKYIIGSKVPCGIWMNDLIFLLYIRVANEKLFTFYMQSFEGPILICYSALLLCFCGNQQTNRWVNFIIRWFDSKEFICFV